MSLESHQPIHSSSGDSNIRKNLIKLVSAASLVQLLQISCAPLITRLYGAQEYGVFAVFMSVATMVGGLSCLRYDVAIMLPDEDSEARGVFRLCLVLLTATIAGLLLVGLPLLLMGKLGTLALLNGWIVLIPVATASVGLLLIFNVVANRQRAYGPISRAKIAAVTIYCFCAVMFGWLLHPSAGWIALAYTLGQSAATIYLFLVLRKSGDFISNRNTPALKSVLHAHRQYPMFNFPMNLFDQATSALPLFLFAAWFSPSIAGMFSLATMVLRLPSMLVGQAIGQVSFERACRLKQRPDELATLLRKMMGGLFIFGLIPLLILVPFGPVLFGWVFGATWDDAGQIARILVFSSCFSLAVAPLGLLPGIYHKLSIHFLFTMGGVMLRLVGLMIGIVMNSWFLAVAMMVVAECVALLAFSLWSYRLIRKHHAI